MFVFLRDIKVIFILEVSLSSIFAGLKRETRNNIPFGSVLPSSSFNKYCTFTSIRLCIHLLIAAGGHFNIAATQLLPVIIFHKSNIAI